MTPICAVSSAKTNVVHNKKQYSAKSSTATKIRCLSGSDMCTATHGMQEGLTFGLPGASWSGRWIGHTPTIQQEEAGWTVGTWRFSKATCIDSGGYGQVFKNMARAWDWEDVGLISRLGEVEISKSGAEMYIAFSIVRQGIFEWWWLMHISRDETWWDMLCLGIGVWVSLWPFVAKSHGLSEAYITYHLPMQHTSTHAS